MFPLPRLYRSRVTADPVLPVLQRRAEIQAALRAHQCLVLCGATGSGKTTQLPQICLALGFAERGIIGHTQPRRLAARSVAARIAQEQDTRLGELVGVKVRFQDQTSPRTRIKLLTDGMLLAELAADPLLSAYSCLILDEAHERSLNIDFLLGYLRTLLPRRPDLKLIVTSATIDPHRFSTHLGGPSIAPVLEVSGRSYPVEIRYQPTTDDPDDDANDFESLEVDAVADAVEQLLSPRAPAGDILVFVPGEREIRAAADALRRRSVSADILPLFARLTSAEQDRIFHPGSARRVIIATNVAETSLTVPGIRSVIDTGFARLNRYDPARKIQRLPIEPISRASADQRAGRCGRLGPGVCIRLYSESSYLNRPLFTDPEIRRTNLASVILQMKALNLGPIDAFPFLDPPDSASLADGLHTLFELHALAAPTADAPLTDLGRAMARLPIEPRVARMLLAADSERCTREVLVLAAALSIQDPRERPLARADQADRAHAVFRNDSSDFLTLLNIWDQFHHAADTLTSGARAAWCRDHFLSPSRLREWIDTHFQLRDLAADLDLSLDHPPAPPDAIHRALLTGLISNVACREGAQNSFEYRGIRGNTLHIFPGSALFKKAPKWIMAAEIVHTTRLYARTVAAIDPDWLESRAAHLLHRQLSDAHLDADTGAPSAWERLSFAGVVIVPRRRADLAALDPAALDPAAARRLFLREALAQCRWKSPEPFMAANRATLAAAQSLEAKLRRRGLLADADSLAAWFAARLPDHINHPDALLAFLRSHSSQDPDFALKTLCFPLSEALAPAARAALSTAPSHALDQSLFPDALTLRSASQSFTCPLTYTFAPGQPADGLTLSLPIAALPLLSPHRPAWLVPGSLPDLALALLKSLPKAERTALESSAPLPDLARDAAALLDFPADPSAAAPLPAALAEAVSALTTRPLSADAFAPRALPDHLKLNVRILDDSGDTLAQSRDLPELLTRFAPRIKAAQAAALRSAFERPDLTTWDFESLPDSVPHPDDPARTLYPALLDRTTHVDLALLDDPASAALHTPFGLRRLFALAIAPDLDAQLAAFPQWPDILRFYQALGSPADLRADLASTLAHRAFLHNQPPPRTRAEFHDRLQADYGKLVTLTRETADATLRILEPRALIARRFSGGTPRLWAQSVADLREQAAYLMPAGFLRLVPWDRLKHYPRFVQSMRERLLNLREDGSGSEKPALAQLAPYWKRFTAHAAALHALARRAADQSTPDPTPQPAQPARASASGSAPPPARSSKPGAAKSTAAHPAAKAPLPPARRAAPSVNLDAGAWSLQPGSLSPAAEAYRWALEDFRVSLFTPALAPRPVAPRDLDALWAKVPAVPA